MKKFLKTLKLQENLIGSVLGVAVVLVSTILLWNYFATVNSSNIEKTLSTATELNLAGDAVASGQLQSEYIVKQGDSLWSIAKQHYGTGYAWQKVYELNKSTIGSNPGLLASGTKLNLPAGETIYPQHTIVRGETLWSVAVTYCGSGQAWHTIAQANTITDPAKIEPGITLKVACK
jgi:nucleoid-associated protein YgaU